MESPRIEIAKGKKSQDVLHLEVKFLVKRTENLIEKYTEQINLVGEWLVVTRWWKFWKIHELKHDSKLNCWFLYIHILNFMLTKKYLFIYLYVCLLIHLLVKYRKRAMFRFQIILKFMDCLGTHWLMDVNCSYVATQFLFVIGH